MNNDVLISFVAYVGTDGKQINLDKYFFGNILFNKIAFSQIDNYEDLKEIIAEKMNEINKNNNILSKYITILNIIK